MNCLALAALLLLPACAATADGQWPSLARRPGEVVSTEASTSAPEPTAVSEAAARTPPSPVSTVAAARIADGSRELQEIETRWRRQSADTQAAANAARGAAASSQPWATAQLELTRLERIGTEIGDLRDRLDAISGDLAVEAAGGSDVSAALRQAGEVIRRVDRLRAEHLQTFENAQRMIAR